MKIYQVDAFTHKLYSGNPAAVIPMTSWLPDEIMQSIAMENNLAESAFIVPEGDNFRIRWFTPAVEVDLCGHATLAAGYVYFNELGYNHNVIRFYSRSGWLTVSKSGEWLTLDFPADVATRIDISHEMRACTGGVILEAWRGARDLMLVMPDVRAVTESMFDQQAILRLGHSGLIVTAQGDDVDFVSRFFAPAYGIAEDPVTGSSHTTMTPYWSTRLGKSQLTARQLSPRGGYLKCGIDGDRVRISGQGVLYMKGDIQL